VIHGPRDRLLGFSGEEHPLAVQLGGSDAAALAEASRICEAFGYREINLNVGCPSDRVQDGRFGACLMREPDLVARCVAAMVEAVRVPVTVKCRIGVDDQDTEAALDAMADAVIAAGASALIVHARKAWLKGLSPKENRDVPPLDYERVYRLKDARPAFPICINGGISDMASVCQHLDRTDGVMLGRAAYHNPGLLWDIDGLLFGDTPPFSSVRAAAESMIPYIDEHVRSGGKASDVTRHMLGLFPGQKGARAFRRHLSTHAVRPEASGQVLREALSMVEGPAMVQAA
jgi:tRNA-dihydrouridine synthase A